MNRFAKADGQRKGKSKMNNFDRFLKITKWAQRRYYGKEENRGLVLDRGGVASKYQKIEDMAFDKLLKSHGRVFVGNQTTNPAETGEKEKYHELRNLRNNLTRT
jgi:hypothetical protein